ncbi:membrane protein [Porphyromonadaceae bacterium COT-184 OH4590]|nr:membrane protein [Porphyromonadaceae bacterium COT-184 OH4590]MDO4725653.1 YbaN family protein [Porphyromonadaceae bacterium]
MRKRLLIVLGFIFLGLGILGIFLPLLPTTPFLLLTAWMFAKSSEVLYQKLLNNKYLGNYIKEFREDRSIPLKTKIIAISLIWLTIGYSIIFLIKIIWVKVVLLIIAVGVTIHILSFKTKQKK